MVFQQFNLFSHKTVLENIILAPVLLGIMPRDKAIKKAKSYLKEIELTDIINSYPHQLSGGQKQRVAIIRTLMMQPEIILFDEPTSALDPEMIGEVTNLMRKIAANGMTMLIVSHEMNFVKNIANKVLFIDNGFVSYFGGAEEAFGESNNKRLKDFLNQSIK